MTKQLQEILKNLPKKEPEPETKIYYFSNNKIFASADEVREYFKIKGIKNYQAIGLPVIVSHEKICGICEDRPHDNVLTIKRSGGVASELYICYKCMWKGNKNETN